MHDVIGSKGKPSQNSPDVQEEQFTKQINELERKITVMDKTIDDLESKIEGLQCQVNKWKKEAANCQKRLEREGKLCPSNCVRLAFHWVVCKKMLNRTCCSEQLRNLVIAYGVEKKKIEKNSMRCDFFMDALLSCNIVEFKSLNQKKIEEVWTKLKQNEGILLLAIKIPDGPGHVVVCDSHNGKVMFHDPAAPLPNGESWEMSQEYLRDYLRGSEDIRFFTVNYDELQELLSKYQDVIHHAHAGYQFFDTTPIER